MRIALAVLLGGLIAGTLDILSAFASYVPNGATEVGILHYIASGLIGKEAAEAGGAGTAALGLAVHYALTLTMALIFVLAAKAAPALARNPWISGPLYGVLVYGAMTYLIVPHSRVAHWALPHGWSIVGGLMAHCLYVGLPIALMARHVGRLDTAPLSRL